MLLLLFIPDNQSWPQNFSVQKMKCHSNREAHVLYLPVIITLLLLVHLSNFNIACKVAEQSVPKTYNPTYLTGNYLRKTESQSLPFQLKQISHQLQWDSH